jgi:hypothetical protein
MCLFLKINKIKNLLYHFWRLFSFKVQKDDEIEFNPERTIFPQGWAEIQNKNWADENSMPIAAN